MRLTRFWIVAVLWAVFFITFPPAYAYTFEMEPIVKDGSSTTPSTGVGLAICVQPAKSLKDPLSLWAQNERGDGWILRFSDFGGGIFCALDRHFVKRPEPETVWMTSDPRIPLGELMVFSIQSVIDQRVLDFTPRVFVSLQSNRRFVFSVVVLPESGRIFIGPPLSTQPDRTGF